jgi:hypothetical protein
VPWRRLGPAVLVGVAALAVGPDRSVGQG